MSITKNDIIEAVSKMSILDICDLVKMMEDKFGVSAQNSISSQSVVTQESVAKDEEKTEFNVVLVEIGSSKISAIKVVRSISGLGLREAKDAVENLPFVIKENVSKEDAASIKKQLEDAGVKVELQ